MCVIPPAFLLFFEKTHVSYLAIFLIICESLNVSCTDPVKRCLSCWWVGGAELHHLPADLSYQRLPDITSQLLLHFICFFYLHLRNCYHASSSCFGLSPFSASSLKIGISSRVRVCVVEKNHFEDKNTDCFNRISANGSLYEEEFLKDWTEEKEDRKIFFLVISAYLH